MEAFCDSRVDGWYLLVGRHVPYPVWRVWWYGLGHGLRGGSWYCGERRAAVVPRALAMRTMFSMLMFRGARLSVAYVWCGRGLLLCECLLRQALASAQAADVWPKAQNTGSRFPIRLPVEAFVDFKIYRLKVTFGLGGRGLPLAAGGRCGWSL